MSSKLSLSRILAIDPGYDRCGIAILDKETNGSLSVVFSTCVTTSRNDTFSVRLLSLRTSLLDVIRTYNPSSAAIEQLFFAKNTKTALAVAEAVGVLRVTLEEASIPTTEYTPMQIKIATTGYGSSDKEAVSFMTKKLLKLQERERLDDEIDALAIAITHAYSYKGV